MYLDEERRPLDVEGLPPTLTIALDPPLVYQQAEVSELVLREPNLSQLATAQGKLDSAYISSAAAQREYELTLIALVANKPRAMMDELRTSSIAAAMAYLEAFVIVVVAMPEPDGEDLVLTLEEPLKANHGGSLHEITLHEPTGGQMLKAEGALGKAMPPLPGPVRRYHQRLIELCAGDLPSMVAGQLPIRKAREAVMWLEGFALSAPATRKRSATA